MQRQERWDALDVLRGLSVIGMLLNLNPGAWELRYHWIGHAAWQGATLIDMVMPTFLFCVGAMIPFSLARRYETTRSRAKVLAYIVKRSAILIVLGLIFNLWEGLPSLRIPGVLQRIGVCFGLVSAFALYSARPDGASGLRLRPMPVVAALTVLFAAYWALLALVPVPGFGAPRFDAVGSWPTLIDRQLFGVTHLWVWGRGPDGAICFDPEGVVSTVFACFNVMVGLLAGYAHQQSLFRHPEHMLLPAGAAAMAVALLLDGSYPIVKSLWTGSFALLSSGFAMTALGALTMLLNRFKHATVFLPARVLGSNALLAYGFCWFFFPFWDVPLFGGTSWRQFGQHLLSSFLEPHLASFSMSLLFVLLTFFVFLQLHRKRRFIRL